MNFTPDLEFTLPYFISLVEPDLWKMSMTTLNSHHAVNRWVYTRCNGIEAAKRTEYEPSMLHNNARQSKGQIVYFSHGGGPLPILGDASHRTMIAFMRQLSSQLRMPDAIVVISAHWEESTVTLLSGSRPPMFYDYYGFPDEAYAIQYPAPGDPELADRIADTLEKHEIPSRLDAGRGFDHGLFIPLKLMYPKAEIPCIQLSLIRGLDPAAHLRLGRALGALMQENILLVGSGFSFHNMRAFSWQGAISPDPANDAFQNWLIDVCTGDIPAEEREQKLAEWTGAPFARYCHPREEHLLPLHVCAAASGKPAELIFDDYILGKRGIAFSW